MIKETKAMESKCYLSVHQRVYETRLNGKEKPQNMMCVHTITTM